MTVADEPGLSLIMENKSRSGFKPIALHGKKKIIQRFGISQEGYNPKNKYGN
jgi:hypothetical protein